MGKIVGGINEYDEYGEGEAAEVEEVVENEDEYEDLYAFRTSYTVGRNKKSTDRDSFIVSRKGREHCRKPIATVNKKRRLGK